MLQKLDLKYTASDNVNMIGSAVSITGRICLELRPASNAQSSLNFSGLYPRRCLYARQYGFDQSNNGVPPNRFLKRILGIVLLMTDVIMLTIFRICRRRGCLGLATGR